jgi:hypothetical protein
MNPNQPPPPASPTPPPAAAPAPKRRPWLLYGCGFFLAFILLVVASVAITVWYLQRPIKPVVLTASEKAVVEQKLDDISVAPTNRAQPLAASTTPAPRVEPDRSYTPGGKALRLTERELNGLLNSNTDLGNTVRLELARDAINAYIAAPIPDDVPLFGGKIFRARGRFQVSFADTTAPYVILDDVTVFGISLPKAWLGGLKGENLLADAIGDRRGRPIIQGIKSLRVEPGALVLEVAD